MIRDRRGYGRDSRFFGPPQRPPLFLFHVIARVYNLYFAADKALAHQVRELAGFAPVRLGLFRRAFAHKSGANRDGGAAANNERLEYLGDAVLGTVVAEFLFKKYPRADEGFLTKMRSKIVKRKSLNYIGEEMGLGVILRERNRMRLSSSMLGNAVEALVGAVYLERGYARTERFVIGRMLRPYLDLDALERTDDNYKSQLLEACQKQGKTITYALVKKFKQERRDRFKVAVVIGGQQVAVADDFNKKAAEQIASLRALEQLGLADNLVVPRRKEKRSRADKRATREGVTPALAPTAPATDNVTPDRRGPVPLPLRQERHSAPWPEPRATATKTTKTKLKRRRSPYDYLIKHGVRTGVAGAAATEVALGLPPKPARSTLTLLEVVRTGAAGVVAAAAREGAHERPARPKKDDEPSASAAAKPARRRIPSRVRHAIQVGATGVLIADGVAEATAAPPDRERDARALESERAVDRRAVDRRAVNEEALRRLIADGAAGVSAAALDREAAVVKGALAALA